MNTFVTDFWDKKVDTIITAVDELIDKLLPERRGWNIYSLLNYLDIVYRSVKKTQIEEALLPQPKGKGTIKKNSDYIIISKYTIFNTGLVNKNNENIYFVKLTDINQETNKYFYTEQEVTELYSEFKGVDSIVKMLRDSFIEIIKDFDKINEVLINTEDNCSEEYQKIKKRIDDIEKKRDDKKYEELKKRIDKELENKDYYSGPGWRHIIIDGSDNLPLPIINAVFGTSYSYIDKGNIRYQIIKEQERYCCIKGILNRAFKRSLLLAKRDFTLIVPTLYPGKNNNKGLKISYLIPLNLMRSDKPDCVFLFNKDENGKFVGKTLLNMEEASLNIRAFGNPEQYSWLRE